MPRCTCSGQGAILIGMGQAVRPLTPSPACPVHGEAGELRQQLARATAPPLCCEYHRHRPGDTAHWCARLIGTEPHRHWQALDLTCAVCGRTPCDTPERCSATARGWAGDETEGATSWRAQWAGGGDHGDPADPDPDPRMVAIRCSGCGAEDTALVFLPGDWELVGLHLRTTCGACLAQPAAAARPAAAPLVRGCMSLANAALYLQAHPQDPAALQQYAELAAQLRAQLAAPLDITPSGA